jgi:hypothetical protein
MFLGRKGDIRTAICGPIVLDMWDPRRLTPLEATATRYTFSLPVMDDCRRLVAQLVRGLKPVELIPSFATPWSHWICEIPIYIFHLQYYGLRHALFF